MANKKSSRRKSSKKNKSVIVKLPLWAVVSLVIVGVVVFAVWYIFIYEKDTKEEYTSSIVETSSEETPISVNGEVQIYSIEMRDKYGDSLFIKYKDFDILIDTGDAGDGEFVRDFVDNHISTDKNLDLLIATHCHSDHMGGLVKTKKDDNKSKALDNVISVSNILDFGHTRLTNIMYNNYVILRDYYINKGANYYPAYDSAKKLNGLSNEIIFDDLKIEIIDTFNYSDTKTDLPSNAEFNDYSVATLITYKNTKLFCAGDLEDVGEKTLIEHSNETSLKDIKESDTVIYKACHHGTDVGTANNKNSGATSVEGGNRMALLQIIKPDYCFVSSAITKSDHPFPRALATMLYFTNNLYFNGTMGTICFDLDGTNVGVQGLGCTTNYTLSGYNIDYDKEKNLKYTETVWYNNHVFEGSHSWYKGDIENPTDKDLTEWYLEKLKEDYPR